MAKTEYPGVAVITGAGSGMGQAVAQSFVKLGCRDMALIDIDSKGLEATSDQLSRMMVEGQGTIIVQICDVADAASVANAFEGVLNKFRRIDYLVNAAGIMLFNEPSADSSIESFDRVQSINYRGLWLCSREALKIMKNQSLDCEAYPDAGIEPARAQRGSIINISSALGVQAMAGSPAYCAAKAGVLSLTRSDAVDYSPYRIRVNAIMPGLIDTPMTRPTKEASEYLDIVAERQAPMRRKGTAQEVADVVLFLSCNRASFVQGAAWAVDGGNLAEKR